MLAGSRIIVAAVSHEVRNVCGAIALVHENLSRSGELTQNKDFEALGTLIVALERIAAMDLRQNATRPRAWRFSPCSTNSASWLSLRCAIAAYEPVGIEADLPPVWADRQSLMQVFLNLTKNSERAMEEPGGEELTVSSRSEGIMVAIRFRDTGGGVAHPERLFRPFQLEAQSTGLGLYLSRALTRSFKGDLRYEPEAGGSTFVVQLSPSLRESKNDSYEQQNSDIADRRSQPVPGEPQPASPDRV